MDIKHKEDSFQVRHCAFCLKVCGFPTKKCGKCQRRAYCSKECQAADWSVKGKGQRHVNWCGRYEYGEEDIDWEVVPVPGKGLGVRAKRLIPAGYRIMVDPIFTDPNDHEGIKDLAPEGATLERKFMINRMAGHQHKSGDTPANYVALRICRLNHNCRPNAANYNDEGAHVDVLVALWDIQPGEEICISYTSFSDINTVRVYGNVPEELEYFMIQRELSKYGIECPKDCYCKNQDARELVTKGRKLATQFETLAQSGKLEKAVEVCEKLLDVHKLLNESLLLRVKTQWDLFRVITAIRPVSRKNLIKGRDLIRAVYETYVIMCPYSEKTKEYKKWFDDSKDFH